MRCLTVCRCESFGDASSKIAAQKGEEKLPTRGRYHPPGNPRDGDARAAFGLFDSEKNEYELIRVEYDVNTAADRIRQAGLPPFLAERLTMGR